MKEKIKTLKKKDILQLNAMLDDVFLLLDDLILLGVIQLNSRRHSGVQRAHTISARGKILMELPIRTVTLRWTFLTCRATQSRLSVLMIQMIKTDLSVVLPRLACRLGLTYMSLLHSTMHFKMDTRHSSPFFLKLSSCK